MVPRVAGFPQEAVAGGPGVAVVLGVAGCSEEAVAAGLPEAEETVAPGLPEAALPLLSRAWPEPLLGSGLSAQERL